MVMSDEIPITTVWSPLGFLMCFGKLVEDQESHGGCVEIPSPAIQRGNGQYPIDFPRNNSIEDFPAHV